jgi:hypothetical protein
MSQDTTDDTAHDTGGAKGKDFDLARLRMFLVLIAAANLLCGAIWTKISYDLSGLFSAGFNIGLVLLLCGIAALRGLSLTRGMVSRDARVDAVPVSAGTGESVPAGAAAPQPPERG